MIKILYHSITFNQCLFHNIICNGDSENSSLMTFISSGINLYTMKMIDVIIQDCQLNGDLIVVKGENSNLDFNRVSIHNIISYGPIFNNLSYKVYSNIYL